MKFRRTAALAAVIAAILAPAAHAGPLYRIASAQTIKSESLPNWDYLTFDPAHGKLYIARRDDGILVYDAKAKKMRGALAGTKGGNAVILAPDLGRGFAITEGGEAVVFDLATRKTLQRVKFGDDGDFGTYDPATKQVMITRGDSSQVTFIDAASGKVVAHLAIDSKKIEGSAPDGNGTIFVTLRDKDKLLAIDARTHQVVSEHSTSAACHQPNGLAFDASTHRIFIGCRGDKPVLAVMDAQSGRIVATPPIGRGNDMVVFDSAQRKIYTSNGVEANMVVIDQQDADTYRIAEATNTRPNARTMALDPSTKAVYLVSAEGAVDASKEWSTSVAPFYPNTYFKNTFTLLTLRRQQ